MNKNFFKFAVVCMGLVLLQGCATYPNQHGTGSMGVRADIDVLGVGVDGSIGVHRAGSLGVTSGIGGVGYGRQVIPGEAVVGVVTSPYVEQLQQLSSCGGAGVNVFESNTQASEFAGRPSYGITARRYGRCDIVGGVVQQQSGQQQYQQIPQQQQYQQQRSYYNGQ